MIREHEQKRVFSIDKIKAELVSMGDALSRWATDTAPTAFFKGTADKKVIDAFQDMLSWVQGEQQFTGAAKTGFASAADGWLVAYAKANGLLVVTHEEFAPKKQTSVPIPNVCLEFDVEYCNTFEMLRNLKVQFVLRKKKIAS